MARRELAVQAGRLSSDSPPDVDALYAGVTRLFDLADGQGRKAGDCTRGVYLFIDYDGEPIYVGQTTEKLRTHIRRHLTNQRTDAVAMRVLDPFEVAEVEMWPFWDLEGQAVGDVLDRAEFTVYQRALTESQFYAVLNEGEITRTEMIALPPSVRGAILQRRIVRAASTPTCDWYAGLALSLIWRGSSANGRSASASAERCGYSLDDSNI